MCCCDDGIHHTPGHAKRKGKFRKTSNNVGGFNLSRGNGGGNEIHLRLRSLSPLHELLSYEEVAGVFIHELAHCEIGPHSVEFYQLMEVIEEQFHTNMVNGVFAAADTMDAINGALFSGVGHTLGSTNSVQRGASDIERKRKIAQAAERRRQFAGITLVGGVVLGGGLRKAKLSPREAAAKAAEQRLKDAQWCMPCNEVIELLDDSGDESIIEPCKELSDRQSMEDKGYVSGRGHSKAHSNISIRTNWMAGVEAVATPYELNNQKLSKGDKKMPARDSTLISQVATVFPSPPLKESAKVAAKKEKNGLPRSNSYIDLTEDNCTGDICEKDDHEKVILANLVAVNESAIEMSSRRWMCASCTFLNCGGILSCEVCGNPQVCDSMNQKLIQDILREEEVKRRKEIEHNRSKEQFGGFNIYEGGRKNTMSMKHLT
eukprot:CAMPEP_0172420644 /NCGR_PEP_ID=MMETSP1064-20121228/7000_1 /TAXON_ID=202472 /ORGANISM="Aulacoseira subarctica , Strain CCAP 1002/5" /LENGTH=431 /DNA_ID=CAMNT_0013160697 /DNA_START=212 /DNA_END=1507 /DNA_ORIENTATION=+